MSAPGEVQFDVYEGPSLAAPFPAVVARFASPCAAALPAGAIEGLLRHFLPPALAQHVTLPLADGAFGTVAAALANALQGCYGPCDCEARAEREADGRGRLVLEYVDPAAAVLTLRAALDLTAAVFARAAGGRPDAQALAQTLQQAAAALRACHPDPLARLLIRAARRRGIPVAPVAPGSRIWLFGQGSAGMQFFEAASHRDALTGSRLARDKLKSNVLVTRLGFPGVVHRVADSPEAARRMARELGFPLVVKPVAGGKGTGVTVHVTDEAALAGAFAEAKRVGGGDVLVERHVEGDDHRLVVLGGRFAWATRRCPPHVTGDGEHSIAELIELENRRRAAVPDAAVAPAQIVVDAEVRALLGAQGAKLADRPAAGTMVRLRRIANVARGATLADCSAAIHPDNRDMAEAIARSFHLDAIGIDFMTPDIGRSWREVECAVLEVNGTPGFSSAERAATVLAARFPPGSDGRIPSVVLIGVDAGTTARVAAAAAQAGRRVGVTDGERTTVGGRPRISGAAKLPARVAALVHDAGCEALVIAVTPAEIARHGFPLARCELAVLAPGLDLDGPLRALVGACAAEVREDAGATDAFRAFGAEALPTAR